MNNQGCSNEKPEKSQNCELYHSVHYEFRGNKCYLDGEYYGHIIYADDNEIMVAIENDNLFMKGRITTFRLRKK